MIIQDQNIYFAVTFKFYEQVYKDDMNEVSTKLYEAAEARDALWAYVTGTIIVLVLVLVVPLAVFFIKGYLKRAAAKHGPLNNRDSELGKSHMELGHSGPGRHGAFGGPPDSYRVNHSVTMVRPSAEGERTEPRNQIINETG